MREFRNYQAEAGQRVNVGILNRERDVHPLSNKIDVIPDDAIIRVIALCE
jgi:hypothetical protein